ncbi:lactonase family protein [Streptomyces hoynatensis]|uniref:Lactonase family protein n=1 Tax=Streptomyces hoynatensis TaxID=1141874 RepID=A0A3A9YP88_9ACTN|nr:lactonase family protein [Streptomyces hoynatensis]
MICVGSYTPEAGGTGPGLTVFREDPGAEGGLALVAELPLPAASFLAWHPWLPVVYAVNELAEGGLTAVTLERPAEPRALGSLATGGAEPCHVAVTADGRFALAANYGSGSVAVFSLAADGRLAARTDLVAHQGGGPVAERQEGPHAHMVTLDAAGGLATVTDLGSDTLWSYRLGPDGRLTRVAASRLPAGCGPRQLVRGPAPRAYALAELGGELLVLSEEVPGDFSVLAARPASGRAGEEGGAGARPNLAAHLELLEEGAYALVSNRGPDSLSLFSLGEAPPVLLAEHLLDAAWPRHFALAGDLLLVAAQHSDTVITLRFDPAAPAFTELARHPVGSPTCVAPRPAGAAAER